MGASDPRSMIKEAMDLFRRGDFDGAIRIYKTVISRHKDHPFAPKARTHCVELCVRLGRHDEALDLAARAGPAGDRDLDLWFAVAQAHMFEAHGAEARSAFTRCLSIDPDHGPSIGRLAMLTMREGDHDGAIADLDDACARGVDSWFVDFAFMHASVGAGRVGEAIDRVRRRLDKRDAPVRGQVELWLGLADLYEREGDYASAWDAAGRGNELGHERWDRDRLFSIISSMGEVFDGDALASLGGLAEKVVRRDRLVFVAGMPRSGTTLIEQVIAAHPDAASAGEPGCLEEAADRARVGQQATAEGLRRLSASKASDAGARLVRALEERAGAAGTLVDKRPFNALYIGALAAIAPGSRVILTDRDPRDVALSCYFRSFGVGMPWSYDMADITELIVRMHALQEHWHRVIPAHAPWVSLTRGRYEKLVDEPEAESRRLVAFSGLAWDDACLRFGESRRVVPTLLPAQVGKGVYAGSVARWRRFEPFAQGAFDGLHALAASMGYETA